MHSLGFNGQLEGRKVIQISKRKPVVFTVFFPRKKYHTKSSGNVAGGVNNLPAADINEQVAVLSDIWFYGLPCFATAARE